LILVVLGAWLASCTAPQKQVQVAVVRNPRGHIQKVSSYYLDSHGRRVLHGDEYVYHGDGAGYGGMGRGVHRVYRDGLLVKEADFVLHP